MSNIVSLQIRDYVESILRMLFYQILSENDILASDAVGNEEIGKIYKKLFSKLENLPDDYLLAVFQPVIK